jgi:elongation factor Ts
MSAQDVAKLREETGAGMMDVKRALDASGGDFEKAKAALLASGLAKAEKKGERVAGAGYLETYIHAGRIGVLLEIFAETDFVTRSEDFRAAAKNIAMQISATAPDTVEALLAQPYLRDETLSVEQYLKGVIAKVGENIKVSRFTRYQL